MDERVKSLWVDALRSKEYRQGRNVLRNSKNEFCCLGVLCDLYAKESGVGWSAQWAGVYNFMGNAYNQPTDVSAWAGMNDHETLGDFGTYNVIEMNDVGSPFSDIANVIEKMG